MKISQSYYLSNVLASRQRLGKVLAGSRAMADAVREARKLRSQAFKAYRKDPDEFKFDINDPIVKAAYQTLMKAGVSSSTGFNFFDLRGPAYFLFPYNTPFIQMIDKAGKVNAGVGTAAHWKATRNPNATNVYVGVMEGQRGPIATPDEVDYLATYKELGMEGGNTFTSQYAGEGYTDVTADEHFRNLARLRLGEEMMTLLGNSGSGPGNQGMPLGVCPIPTTALVAGGAIPDATKVTVACVAISGMGLNPSGQGGYVPPPTVANGLIPAYTVYPASGGSYQQSGGVSAVSALGTSRTTGGGDNTVTAVVAPVPGAFAYAWFVSFNGTPTLANAFIYAITPYANVVVNSTTVGSQAANTAGLSSDNSFSTLDFDGLLTYAFKYGNWVDMNGGSFTPGGNGLVDEVEADLQYFWDNFQVQPDAIWCSADTRRALDQAIVFSQTGTNSYIFAYDRSGQDSGLLGGYIVSAYKSKYSLNPSGGASIPIRLHPMLPNGTLYYDLNTNPYPHSRIPAVRRFLTQRDYYSIEWPVTTRQWTYGTYIHEVLAHYMPWASGLRTGVGPFVPPS